jgi:hypothetical protein
MSTFLKRVCYWPSSVEELLVPSPRHNTGNEPGTMKVNALKRLHAVFHGS